MTVTSRWRRDLDEPPTYNHGVAPATPPLPYHAFAVSRHHVAAQLVSMAGYDDDEQPYVNAQTSQMSADSQPRKYSDIPDDDTPTKRQKLHHPASPGPQHVCMIARPAPSAPYAGLPPGPGCMNAPAKHLDMLPPPNSVHGSWQALHDYAQSHAAEHGYALSINTTAKNRSRIKLACVCFGQPKNTHKLTAETRVRKNRVSYKTGCKMWIEGKKLEDGSWFLRVGEPLHNHPGRDSAGWAVQRKRTWGLVGGRIGMGGVTAKEELAKQSQDAPDEAVKAVEVGGDECMQSTSHKYPLERGGLVWKIVEQEMLRKNKPNHGRDRGVGRTVDVLKLKLPGIHILKRDVYNIRAQIKRARKAAGQQVGDGVETSSPSSSDDDDDGDNEADEDEPNDNTTHSAHNPPKQPPPMPTSHSIPNPIIPPSRKPSRIDPSLNLPIDNHNATSTRPLPPSPSLPSNTPELELLRRENAELRRLLADRTKEVKEKTIEMAGLRSQVELLSNIMLTSGRGLVPP